MRWKPPNVGGGYKDRGREPTIGGGGQAGQPVRHAEPPHPWVRQGNNLAGQSEYQGVQPRNVQGSSFQPLTVQQMLEAQQKMFGDMMMQFQRQMHQSLQQYQVPHLVQKGVQGQQHYQQQYQGVHQMQGGVQGLGGVGNSRPFSFPKSST